MRYRSFGRTALVVSELGFGCQSLGGGLYHRHDAESVTMLQRALDAGVNFFDTSDHYSQGASEALLGLAFRGRRNRVVLATKGGTFRSPLGELALRARPLARPVSGVLRSMKRPLHRLRRSQRRYDFSARYLTRAVEASLKRLQTDYVDVYQVHKPPTPLLEAGAFCEVLERLKAQGKLRYYGVSCETVAQAVLCLRHPGIASVQVGLSLLDLEAVAELLPLARAQGLAVIARNPRAQGLLTEAHHDITAEETAAQTRDALEERTRRARGFRFLVKADRTLAQAAIQFVLQLPGVSTTIPRAVNQAQLEEHLGALRAPALTQAELGRIFGE